jgi:hypothetical protein
LLRGKPESIETGERLRFGDQIGKTDAAKTVWINPEKRKISLSGNQIRSNKRTLLLKLIVATGRVRPLRKQRFQHREQERQAPAFQLNTSTVQLQARFEEATEISQVAHQSLEPGFAC